MAPSGHYRLWVNGIHHGDISLNNLMYAISPTGEPKRVLNDYDLAFWNEQQTENHDRIGTIPFMALELVENGFDDQVSRLYRHDAESLIWVLVYITVITVEYENRSIKISRPVGIDAWFRRDPVAHVLSKQALSYNYGTRLEVTEPHKQYTTIIKHLAKYWIQLFSSSTPRSGPEADDPKRDLESFIRCVEEALSSEEAVEAEERVEVLKEFTKVKVLLSRVLDP